MAKINKAPTPAKFASEWTKAFASAVRSAAGTDGRLTVAEAKKLAKAAGAPKLFADNAQNYLTRTGQKSVSVEKLISASYDYAEAKGRKAAGSSGTISLVEGRKLPADLQADFAYLRGKELGELAPPVAGNTLLADLKARVKGVVLESDDGARGSLNAVYSTGTLTGALTPSSALDLLKPQWSELKKNIWGDAPLDVNFADLGDVTKLVAESSGDTVFEDQNETPEELADLLKFVKASLKDVQLVRVTVPDASDSALLVVGKTPDNHVAGFITGVYVDG